MCSRCSFLLIHIFLCIVRVNGIVFFLFLYDNMCSFTASLGEANWLYVLLQADFEGYIG